MAALEGRIKVCKVFSHLELFYLFSDRLAFRVAFADDSLEKEEKNHY